MVYVFLAIIGGLLLTNTPCGAADLGTPHLAENPAVHTLFDQTRFLTSGGVKYEAWPDLTLEPQIGIGHEMRERDLGSGIDEVTHRVHARAGGKVDLSNNLYVSAAAKLPVYTTTLTGQRVGEDPAAQSPATRQDYDLLRRPGGSVGWGGEVGIRLGLGSELKVFYDQSPAVVYPGDTRSGKDEEKFGTKIIFRFW